MEEQSLAYLFQLHVPPKNVDIDIKGMGVLPRMRVLPHLTLLLKQKFIWSKKKIQILVSLAL